MLRNVFLVSLLIYAVCAAHWEIREVDSAEDELEEILADMTEQQIFDKCAICKYIMKKVKKRIPSNATPDEIKTKLNNTCEKARLLKSKCKHFVEKYLSTLIDELMTDDGPKTICIKLNACKPEPPIKEFILAFNSL
ncbi:NK-lysin tandem duplicate 2 [Megalobrama amblycephala]|uniref:NK-lysin tandem duplicate 2 n=1 Tax=Megalobrama amblycephala TaxID=75352 RepID=UPI0020142F63|nr:NK-lysin tandem duplicate 2 [Megalobrama amblycephala]